MDQEVVHRVTQSSYPNWIGTDRVKTVELDADSLILNARGTVIQGHKVAATLYWERTPKA
jgi:hypothetical protein